MGLAAWVQGATSARILAETEQQFVTHIYRVYYMYVLCFSNLHIRREVA